MKMHLLLFGVVILMTVRATTEAFDIYQFHVWPYPSLLNILESEVSFANGQWFDRP